MSIDALSRPLHVLSTRVYESGPSKVVVKPEQISTSKQEEWLTSHKKEELVTKQIETRVQREVFVDENGEVVEAGEPDVKTSTTEDIKTNETETTEHKTTGNDSPFGSGWMVVPGSTVVKEKIHKRNTNHVTREEKTDAEEVEELNGFSREALLRGIDSHRNYAIKGRERHSSSGSRPSPSSETVVETEEVREVSQALGDTILSTDKRRTTSRELSSSPSFPIDEIDGSHVSRARRNGKRYDRPRTSPPSPPPIFTRKRSEPLSPLSNVCPTKIHPATSPPPSVTVTSLQSPNVSTLNSTKIVNGVTTPGEKCKDKETSRWIQSHFGSSPSKVTAVLHDIPSPVRVSSNVQRTTDEVTSPNHFSAIKDYFQNAVEQTENYYNNERSNTINRRDRASKASNSSSGSNTPTPRSGQNKTSWSVSNTPVPNDFDHRSRSMERNNGSLRRTESLNDSEIPRQSYHRSAGNDSFRKATAQHDDYTAYSTLQRGKPSALSIPPAEDQEISVQRIINSLRSPQLKDSSLGGIPSPRTTSPAPNVGTRSRLSSDGKHVIKIAIPTTASNPSLYPMANDYGPPYANGGRSSSMSNNGISPSQRLRMRVSTGGISMNKHSHLNRSTPALNQLHVTSGSDFIPSERSASSLGLNQIDTNDSRYNNASSLRKSRSKSGSSSIWISNNESDTKRHQFMQGLLEPRDAKKLSNGYHTPYSSSPSPIESPTTTPTPPPRRRFKNRSHSPLSPPPRQKHSSETPLVGRPMSPDSIPSHKPFYYLGEADLPPRSDSPITRVEKTTKRRVTTTKTQVKDADPYPDHVWKPSSAEKNPSRSRRHKTHKVHS